MLRSSFLQVCMLLLVHPGMFQIFSMRTAVIFTQVQTHLASLGLGFRPVLASVVPGEGGISIPSAYGIT